MPEHKKTTRRDFFKQSICWAGAGALAIELGWSSRLLEPKYQINESNKDQLESAGDKITPYISDYFWNGLPPYSNNTPLGHPNASVFGQALTRLAYLDGGYYRVDQVSELITETSLNFLIFQDDHETNAFIRFLEDNKCIIGINNSEYEKYLQILPKPDYDLTLIHELYHFVQIARDPQFHNLIDDIKSNVDISISTFIGIAAAKYVSDKELTEDETYILSKNRRLLLKGALAGTFGIFSGLVASQYITPTISTLSKILLSPIEQQAHLQSGTYGLPPFLNLDNFEDLRGKFLTFNQR